MEAYTAQIQAKMVEKEPEAERTEQAGRAYGGYHGGNCICAHMYNFVRAAFKAS